MIKIHKFCVTKFLDKLMLVDLPSHAIIFRIEPHWGHLCPLGNFFSISFTTTLTWKGTDFGPTHHEIHVMIKTG